MNDQIARNANFTSELLSADSGLRKNASADLNKWLVTYQRQDGVFRQFMPPQAVEADQFAESVDTRDPHVIRTIKPRSAGAISTNFDTGTISPSMYADKYVVYLHRAWSPVYRIDKAYLASYKGDLLGMFKDLSLQDLLGTEDIEGMNLLRAAVGDEDKKNDEIGIKQNISVGTDINIASITNLVTGLTLSSDNLTPAKGLIHRSFWYAMVNALQAGQVGDNIAENALLGNVAALEESLLGIKWLTILDKNLVSTKEAFVTADAEFCGDFVTWGDAQVFTEVKDGAWVEMFANEVYGMALPSKGCVVRGTFGKAFTSWE